MVKLDIPGWKQLTDPEKEQVNKFISDLRMRRMTSSLMKKMYGGRREREVVQEEEEDGITYRLEFVRCGKKGCKCTREGGGHGPYWYAYWRSGDFVRSRYIGKDKDKKVLGNGREPGS